MSLVYDALRQPPADAAVVRGTQLPHGAPWRSALAGYRRPALWLLCGVLVAGPLGFLLSRQAPVQAPLADANPVAAEAATPAIATEIPARASADGNAPVAATAAATPVSTGADAASVPAPIAGPPANGPAASVATDAPAIAAAPATGAATAGIASATAVEPAPADTVAASAAGAGTQTEVQVVASQIKVSVRRRDAANGAGPAEDDDADPRAVREAMAALDAAVGTHDAAASATAIARLQALLPSGSLTLLRARAWAAHGSGDLTEAEHLYHAILDRVPDDEHAEVNLALLDARNGDVDDARARLNRLAARNARSPQVLQAIAELDAVRR